MQNSAFFTVKPMYNRFLNDSKHPSYIGHFASINSLNLVVQQI